MNMLDEAIKRQPCLPRFLSHLYQRLTQDKLNLITGAGISFDAGVPLWHKLLERLASQSEELSQDLQKHKDSGLNPEYLGQILYHRHRNNWNEGVEADLRDATIENGWAEAIHDAIYQDVPDSIEKVLKSHPYLNQVTQFARKVPLVINFNFDDILSDALGYHNTSNPGVKNRSFTVTWHPPIVERQNTTTVYHVNGILPRVSLRKRSPKITFTEDSFSDALARSPDVSKEYLFLRFVQNTMLIVGHSLSDSSLKNYLRRNRDKSPANHHYMIYWIEKTDSLTMDQQADIFEANLELYNIITIFLTSKEINALFSVLNKDDRSVRDILESSDPEARSRFHYYIVGPVASGKSTLLEHLRCFNTFEEWTRPPPEIMYLSSDKLDESNQRKVDDFIYSELKEKNLRMDQAGIGIHFMDRAPLDLYAFSKNDDERKQKTCDLVEKVTRDKPLLNGSIVFLDADGSTLMKRNLRRGRLPGKAGGTDYLRKQAEALKEIYSPTYILECQNKEPSQVAKEVARHALLEPYSPLDLESILSKYS
ncbi:MAG: SIR2 family protein [Candidatus Thiodiazotropha taylori]|nr:SIR2 family protein [Candidatus Thiodiazotropha taylori]